MKKGDYGNDIKDFTRGPGSGWPRIITRRWNVKEKILQPEKELSCEQILANEIMFDIAMSSPGFLRDLEFWNERKKRNLRNLAANRIKEKFEEKIKEVNIQQEIFKEKINN